MEITENHFANKEMLEEIYNNTFNLAMRYDKGRVPEIVQVLGQRLINI